MEINCLFKVYSSLSGAYSLKFVYTSKLIVDIERSVQFV
jgi:hypothetical protein